MKASKDAQVPNKYLKRVEELTTNDIHEAATVLNDRLSGLDLMTDRVPVIEKFLRDFRTIHKLTDEGRTIAKVRFDRDNWRREELQKQMEDLRRENPDMYGVVQDLGSYPKGFIDKLGGDSE